MKKSFRSERLVLEEISEIGSQIRHLIRGLAIGQLIAMIRKQLGMSQKTLASRAKIPQPTLSLIEQNKGGANLNTLKKILNALSSDIILVPVLREPIDVQRRKQAHRMAEKHIRYLKGTMSLEKQEPDARFLEELRKEKEEELLHSNKMLWEEERD
jgi:transcriptional regulator with XRE-family HTH domain